MCFLLEPHFCFSLNKTLSIIVAQRSVSTSNYSNTISIIQVSFHIFPVLINPRYLNLVYSISAAILIDKSSLCQIYSTVIVGEITLLTILLQRLTRWDGFSLSLLVHYYHLRLVITTTYFQLRISNYENDRTPREACDIQKLHYILQNNIPF